MEPLPKEGLIVLAVMIFMLVFGSTIATFSCVTYAGYAIAGLLMAFIPAAFIVGIYSDIKRKIK